MLDDATGNIAKNQCHITTWFITMYVPYKKMEILIILYYPIKITHTELGMVVYTCNSSTLEPEEEGLWVQGDPGQHNIIQASVRYIVEIVSKITKHLKPNCM
jgi:hypothetical protein